MRRFALARDQRGVLHVPLAACLFVICLFAFGTLGLLLRWHQLARTQIGLDRCVGQQARKLLTLQRRVEGTNRAIEASRAAIVAAALEPALIPPLRAALLAQAASQDALLALWQVERLRWSARGGCAGVGRRLPPPILSDAGWQRPPPDAIGPRALALAAEAARIVISLKRGSRVSASEIVREGGNGKTQTWHARYTDELGARAGLD